MGWVDDPKLIRGVERNCKGAISYFAKKNIIS